MNGQDWPDFFESGELFSNLGQREPTGISVVVENKVFATSDIKTICKHGAPLTD